jgi:adenine phosphoribosyltransferase
VVARPTLLAELGPALAELHSDGHPTAVAAIEASGFVLGPLVALSLGVGLVEVRKDVRPADVGERLL